MITTKCAKTVARPNEKSTSKIVGAIFEVLRVRMLHNRETSNQPNLLCHIQAQISSFYALKV